MVTWVDKEWVEIKRGSKNDDVLFYFFGIPYFVSY